MSPFQHVKVVVTEARCGPKGLLIVACLAVLSQAACVHVLVAEGALLGQAHKGRASQLIGIA